MLLRDHSPPTAKGGFTLIELMISLVLLSIFSVIAQQAWNTIIPRYRVKVATADIHSLIRKARADALSQGQQLLCDGERGCSRFETTGIIHVGHDRDRDGQLSETELTEAYRLPDGVTVTWKRFRGNALMFGHRGIAHFQNGSFYVCSTHSAKRIVMNWIGRPRIETATLEDCQ